ncbi:response regulator [Paenibacillus thalictri]|uniref:Response regulator transcription factor n=1 Tax=Paenibacillus thalictri TaxID=2527873 RepID=A0A4Q9E0R4_9BACL|nr:response regulator transcription factor [Paenibacillus thalictri]TBL81733.1 response regulator transcription factor [Paenibacillus thalictri]
MKYRLLIADDHPMARSAVRSLVEGDAAFQIVGEAANGEEAVQLCEALLPDVVLMDINMPVLGGLEATRKIKIKYPHIRVVMLTVSDDVADLFAAIQYGAQGYLLKNMNPADWTLYLHALIDDNADLSRQMADKLFQRFRSGPRAEEPQPSALSAREQEIAARIASGDSNRQIAEQLFITENTVKNHIKNILAKLELDNRVQLTAYAIRHGLTQYSHNEKRK